MKLLYTRKQFQGELEKALKPLNEKNEELNKKISNKEFKYLEEKNKLEEQNVNLIEANEYQRKVIELKDEDLSQLSKKYKELSSTKGEYIARINELIRELEKAKNKIKDLESDRYLIKKVPSGRKAKTQEMKIYSNITAANSKIIKKVKE